MVVHSGMIRVARLCMKVRGRIAATERRAALTLLLEHQDMGMTWQDWTSLYQLTPRRPTLTFAAIQYAMGAWASIASIKSDVAPRGSRESCLVAMAGFGLCVKQLERHLEMTAL